MISVRQPGSRTSSISLRKLYTLTTRMQGIYFSILKSAPRLALLAGQVADGIATPLVGILSDRTKSEKIGRRTLWYICGIIIVIPSFLGTFSDCLFCNWSGDHSRGLQLFYYLLLPSLFNIGWASVQISNMSLVVNITYSQKYEISLTYYV